MRAVIYARYSTENQRDASIEDQVRICKERIAQQGWTLVATYSDSAMSGSHRLRPGYQRLLQDARAGQFELVVAEAMDRLSRDQEDIAGLYKHLSFAGIKLLTLAEGDVSELHVGLKGTMNALFLKDLAAKTHRGLRGRVEAGRSGGGLCYGYDVVKEFDAAGERIRGGRTINEHEAEIVRRIFTSYASGSSPRAIAVELNKDGVPGPAGAEWGPSTINGNAARGTGILNNELYVGRMVWNRLKYIKDPTTGKRVSRLNEPAHWIVQDAPELRILLQDLWNDVKARQKLAKKNTRPDANSEKPFWERRRPRFLLSGLAKCGECGSSYVKINASLFGCAAVRDRGTCTNRRNIRIDDLENIVLDGLRDRLMDPDLFKVFCEEYYKEVNRLRMDESASHDANKNELERLERRIRKIVALITEDDAPARALKDELKVLEARQDQLTEVLKNSEAPKPFVHPGMAGIYRQKVATLQSAINEPALRDEAFEIVRSLIDHVLLVPTGKGLSVEIKGELAGILDLCSDAQKKRPGTVSSAGLSEQLKMVAGTRYTRESLIVPIEL